MKFSSMNSMTREEAIAKCESSQPDAYSYSMFGYSGYDSETIFKCRKCGFRFLATPESIWRSIKNSCPSPTCTCNRTGE